MDFNEGSLTVLTSNQVEDGVTNINDIERLDLPTTSICQQTTDTGLAIETVKVTDAAPQQTPVNDLQVQQQESGPSQQEQTEPSETETMETVTTETETGGSTENVSEESNFEENVERPKKKRRTEKEQIEFNKRKYALLEPCRPNCRQSCSTKFSEEERKMINNIFWSLSFEKRRLWLDGYIVIETVKQRKVSDIEFSRNHSLFYHLPQGASKTKVCKAMFLRTLGLKTDKMITNFVIKKSKDQAEGFMSCLKDRRGSSQPPNKKETQPIIEHILSFNPQVSHYRLEHAPNRRYLDPNLTVKSMWEDYAKNNDVSYPTYYRAFISQNIGFGSPSQDECDICEKYKAHQTQMTDSPEHNETNCEECTRSRNHLNKAAMARHEYQSDSQSKNSDIFAVDMQKVILLPKMTTKEHFFVSRLVVFNETFACFDEKNDRVILWHEAIAGRLAGDVASAYIKCINLSEKENIIFWADNCTAQNKNWTLYTALAWCVNQEWGPQSIRIKYLEKGHTFMRADSIHGKIGTKMKSTPNIFTFDDFVALCSSSGKSIKPTCMNLGDFYNFADGHRSRQNKRVKIPQLQEISDIKFTKQSRSFFFKRQFDEEEFTEVDFLKVKFNLTEAPSHPDQPRGIKPAKTQGIMKLTESFPSAKTKFWHELSVNARSNDLLNQYE